MGESSSIGTGDVLGETDAMEHEDRLEEVVVAGPEVRSEAVTTVSAPDNLRQVGGHTSGTPLRPDLLAPPGRNPRWSARRA